MHRVESLEEFYAAHPARREDNGLLKGRGRRGHFNVYPRGFFCRNRVPFKQHAFYKISLLGEASILTYAERTIRVPARSLVFCNPHRPYSWESVGQELDGYFCIFSEDFIPGRGEGQKIPAPFSAVGDFPIYALNDRQYNFLCDVYERMLTENATDYGGKQELLYHYVQIIVHEALKIAPIADAVLQPNGSGRLVAHFSEILEAQFPAGAGKEVKLRTPNDFADQLSVHVNYLNKVVKGVTGKTTTELISDRMLKEAKNLLLDSQKNIAEISYLLGFEYPAHFHRWFKQRTGQTPGAFRK